MTSRILVLQHGFSGVNEFYLDDYANLFAEAGLGVLVYDPRGFGDSDGRVHPRARNGERLDWALTAFTAHGQSDLPRHKAATSLHDAWRALIAWQPMGDRSDVKLRHLRAFSRELHGLFAAAVREDSAGRALDPKASAEAQMIKSRVAELPS